MRSPAKSSACDRSLLTLCSLRLCGSLKRAIAKSPRCDHYSSVFFAPLWFVKKSDRLQNLQCAIALFFLCVLCASVVRKKKRSLKCWVSNI
ncbi:hypothetical protein [Nostoc sp. CALU 1950]|uniref:hypothetical protein n=1 Tax=Nostoc sp. CALU 1950 TaxID=3104321 RepID=UPI003EB76097